MKIAFLYGPWSVGSRPLNAYADNLNISTRGLTGSELSLFATAEEFVKLGHDVSIFTIFVPNTKPDQYRGIKFYHYEQLVIIDDSFDAVISLNEPDCLRSVPVSCLRIVCEYLNDWTFCAPGFDDAVDHYTAPCQKLIDRLTTQPNAPSKEKFSVVPLGCEPSWYNDGEKISGRVVWTSSADRGLHWLLMNWSKIKALVPYASLRVFYNFDYGAITQIEPHDNQTHHTIVEMANRVRYMKEALLRLKHLDVEHVGSISRQQMKEELSQAEVLAYPCDTTQFSEGFSVSILESCAAGVLPVISKIDCLESIYGGVVPMIDTPVKDNLDQFVKLVVRGLTDEKWRKENSDRCKEFAHQYTWSISAKKLEEIVIEKLKTK